MRAESRAELSEKTSNATVSGTNATPVIKALKPATACKKTGRMKSVPARPSRRMRFAMFPALYVLFLKSEMSVSGACP